MKLQPAAQNILEWIAMRLGLVPTPVAWSHFGFMASAFLLEAVDSGVLEAIGHTSQTPHDIAIRCQLNEQALGKLLTALASMKLVQQQGAGFVLSAVAKKWLLKDSPHSLYWLLIFDKRVCQRWMDHTGTYLRTGKGLQYHDTFTGDEWFYYQQAMACVARNIAREAAARIPVPRRATDLLDIGGAHGLYSIAFCKKNPALSATILDLPQALEQSKPIAEAHRGNAVLHFQPGNILTTPLPAAQYDVVIMASVAHHLTAEENELVAKKVSAALKPGGYFAILEVPDEPGASYGGNMFSALGSLFFALSSTSGAWSLSQMKEWQQQAGLISQKTIRLWTLPGYVAVIAKKN